MENDTQNALSVRSYHWKPYKRAFVACMPWKQTFLYAHGYGYLLPSFDFQEDEMKQIR